MNIVKIFRLFSFYFEMSSVWLNHTNCPKWLLFNHNNIIFHTSKQILWINSSIVRFQFIIFMWTRVITLFALVQIWLSIVKRTGVPREVTLFGVFAIELAPLVSSHTLGNLIGTLFILIGRSLASVWSAGCLTGSRLMIFCLADFLFILLSFFLSFLLPSRSNVLTFNRCMSIVHFFRLSMNLALFLKIFQNSHAFLRTIWFVYLFFKNNSSNFHWQKLCANSVTC